MTAPAAVFGLVGLVTAGCSVSDDGAGPAVPRPSGKAADMCRTLHTELPKHVDGQARGTTESKYTAVWGDPAIELRCGVGRPQKLTPGSEEYNPTSEAAEVNGVSWLLEKRDGGYRFTTTDRTAYVELTVPDDYAPEVNALTDLGTAVRRSVPKRSG
ncbi:DUF3515 domain-containing protein [Streptomyces iconiensis]|uniref:DUF3515 domain-containing protein n=1 Tax=Streptomyces iconiensis TaxID=1384038 RepID=A0ABT6ZV58_9ACTN|nr:DUF3515 domain-containing protein [Streptomyces iconiensis]MDJ1132521.1 DUF3515 domain-containing protein [Streptomyces iconiensis]